MTLKYCYYLITAHHRNDNPDLIASTQLPYNSRHHHHQQHHQVYLHQQQLPYDQTNQIQPTHEVSAIHLKLVECLMCCVRNG